MHGLDSISGEHKASRGDLLSLVRKDDGGTNGNRAPCRLEMRCMPENFCVVFRNSDQRREKMIFC